MDEQASDQALLSVFSVHAATVQQVQHTFPSTEAKSS